MKYQINNRRCKFVYHLVFPHTFASIFNAEIQFGKRMTLIINDQKQAIIAVGTLFRFFLLLIVFGSGYPFCEDRGGYLCKADSQLYLLIAVHFSFVCAITSLSKFQKSSSFIIRLVMLFKTFNTP